MKGRYAGCHMTIYGTILPGAISIARWATKTQLLTSKAKWRLKVIDWHRNHQGKIALTARHFGLTRYTVRSWLKRFNQSGIASLNDKSHRPKHLRKPTTAWEIVMAVVKLRQQYPAWSKYKIEALLKQKDIKVSASTIGRILKKRGLINHQLSKKRSKSARHPKARFPKGLKISSPGEMVQMDTKHIMLSSGKRYYQFTAIDVLSKRRVLEVYPSESSRNGAVFLKQCLKEFPFKVKAVQTDNGATFLKEFELLVKAKKLPHYFIYPRQAKQNTYVEISHQADKREFYQQGNVYQDFKTMRDKIKEWEDIWNRIRPHEALGQISPNDYLEKYNKGRIPTKDVITLQA